MTEPLKNNFTNEQPLSPWRAMDKSIEKSQGEDSRRPKKVVPEVNEDDFYKDLPKANQGW
jgi:hypothetical protein